MRLLVDRGTHFPEVYTQEWNCWFWVPVCSALVDAANRFSEVVIPIYTPTCSV